jgi:hypothetical protein
MTQFNDEVSNTQLAALRKSGEEKLVQAMAPQYGYDYLDLRGITINPEAIMKISETDARTAGMIPFALTRQLLSIGVIAPNSAETSRVLSTLTGKGFTLKPYLISNASLEHGLKRYADQKNTTASKRGVLDINPDDIFKLTKVINNVTDVDIPKNKGSVKLKETFVFPVIVIIFPVAFRIIV